MVYNYANNRQTTDCADLNGNINSAAGGCGTTSYNYDVSNRVVSLASSSPNWQYSYAPHNRRVWRGVWTGSTLTTDEVTFWAGSRKLGTWALSWSGTQLIATMTTSEYYFAGRLIKNNTGYVASDRLGSIGKFYPWGQEKPSATTNGTEKFTGYYRDSETGNDYAVNRYHQPGMGRFLTADPSRKSMVPGNPGSWNRYAYVLGDPVNGRDPTGMDSGLTEEYCNANPDDPDCQAGDYCEGFKTCEPGSAGGDSGGGDGSGVCSSDTLGALAGAVEECVDPAPPPPPAPPTPDCGISVAYNGQPSNQDVTDVPGGPPTNTLGPYSTIGEPGLAPRDSGWFYADQVQATLSGDTNSADWSYWQNGAITGTVQIMNMLTGAVQSGNVSILMVPDGPDPSNVYSGAGVIDWLDTPGWAANVGGQTVVSANLIFDFTAGLDYNGTNICTKSWNLSLTVGPNGWSFVNP